MTSTAPAESFYRAALAAARRIDHDSDHRVLDADADAAWRAYGADMPDVVRCDLVLRNLAMLHPAAFAPGPVFGLPGWHEDDPWGAGFVAPPAAVIEGLFADRAAAASAAEALDEALDAWGLGGGDDADLAARISTTTHLIVAGPRAAAAVARAFVRGERLSWRTQVVVVSEGPSARHIAGITCALLGERGVPPFVEPSQEPGDTTATWAARERERLGAPRAQLCVLSSDATRAESEAARALGAEGMLELARG